MVLCALMKTLAARIADRIEADIERQLGGQLLDLGEGSDDLQAEALALLPSSERQMISIAMRFWEDWADCAQHGWMHHEPVSEDEWIVFAREIIDCLRNGHVTGNEVILELFMPSNRTGLFTTIRRVLGLGT